MGAESPDIARVAEVVRSGFGGKRLLVIGDLMLDRYLWGDVSRISPEAPVPVLRYDREATRAGGAGNVALNIAGLGLNVAVAGFTGADASRDELVEILAAADIDVTGIVSLNDRPTITKTRIITGHQHVLRVDAEELDPIGSAHMARLLANGKTLLTDKIDGIVLSDYAKGALNIDVCQAIIDAARDQGIPVFVDPKGSDYSRYRNATALTPNLAELQLATGIGGRDVDALIEAGRKLVGELGIEYLVLTRGADGMTLITQDATEHCAAVAREVFDVTGAGDTVIATLAAAHIAGLAWREMLHVANLAAGIVVGKVGTVAIDQSSLLQSIHETSHGLMDSVYTLEELGGLVQEWRSRGEKIVFTNGCFDILHAGHVTYLQKAAQEGQRLIVALNTDRSVRELKGSSRPVTAEGDRACVIAALAAVDAVVFFDESTPLNVIEALRPDVLVKGGDYTRDQVVGATEVESWGGRVVLVPLVEGRSTSKLIKKIVG